MKAARSSNQTKRRVLESTIADSWYPGDAQSLDRVIRDALRQVPAAVRDAGTDILVLPHAGYAYSAQTAAYGIKRILGASFTRVVLLAPSHRAFFENTLVAPEADAVSTPYGVIEIDREALQAVAQRFKVMFSDAIHANEHSTQIQYPMLQAALKEFKLVPLIVGSMDYASALKAAEALRPVMDGKTLLVVSSDFTHYGSDFDFAPFDKDVRRQVEALDRGAFDCIAEKNPRKFMAYIGATGATICGRNPLCVMLAMAPPDAVFELAHYETSSDATKDFSRFVCYMCVTGRAGWGG